MFICTLIYLQLLTAGKASLFAQSCQPILKGTALLPLHFLSACGSTLDLNWSFTKYSSDAMKDLMAVLKYSDRTVIVQLSTEGTEQREGRRVWLGVAFHQYSEEPQLLSSLNGQKKTIHTFMFMRNITKPSLF